MTEVRGYHAHVYYDESTFEQARQLCEAASTQFTLRVGRMHRRPVGPHPCWSCQLAFTPDLFGAVVPWLALHRQGLVVLVHPDTGDALRDHTEHAIWLGTQQPLRLEVFSSPSGE